MGVERRAFIAGDPLRAIAALSVLTFHAAVYAQIATGNVFTGPSLAPAFGNHLGAVLGSLDLGLYLFFVLSGYLVGGRFVRAWVWGEPLPRAGTYLLRRARRIVPAFWIVAALVIARFGTRGADWHEVLAIFLFAQNLDPSQLATELFPQTWTLDVEAEFYLALPLIALVTISRGARARLGTALVVLAAIAAATLALRMALDDPRGILSRTLIALAFAFTPGMALAAVEPLASKRLAGASAGRALAFLLVGLGIAGFLLLAQSTPEDEAARGPWFLLASGSFVGAALVWQWATGGCPRWLDNRPLHALGRWSYGIYLIHVAVLEEFLNNVPEDAAPREALAWLLLLALPASIAAAAASWRWIERPLLEGRRRPPDADVAP